MVILFCIAHLLFVDGDPNPTRRGHKQKPGFQRAGGHSVDSGGNPLSGLISDPFCLQYVYIYYYFSFSFFSKSEIQAMLPSLPQYMIALLKILLAAAPTSKAKTDSINIMADVLPEEMP
jgi:hypothetical protein